MWSRLAPAAHLSLRFFFSFYGYAAHRVLHSFPTRRSSDLQQRRHVFAAVDRQIDVVPEQRILDFFDEQPLAAHFRQRDRKSTRLNSSHLGISYAVFCLKKKTYNHPKISTPDLNIEAHAWRD